MTTTRLGLAVLFLMGCAGAEPTSPSSEPLAARADEPGSTRASRELVVAQTQRASAVAPTPVAVPAPRPLFVARPIDAEEAEDGRGAVIAATQPIAFDLDARRFPVRALDPVLHVGELSFTRYTYPSPGLLRFVAADRSALPIGARVFVEYAGDAASRTVVADALVLP